MKVILISKIKTLGNIGDIKVVADGYGRNYLLPKKLAIIYTERNYKSFEEQKKAIEAANQENKNKAEELMNKIKEKDLVLIESAGDNDRLYGSISAAKLSNFVNTLLKQKKAITKNDIVIKDPIRTLGKFTITFDLHPEVSFEKDIIIARSKEEAEKIKKGEFVNKNEKKPLQDDKIEKPAKQENKAKVIENTEAEEKTEVNTEN